MKVVLVLIAASVALMIAFLGVYWFQEKKIGVGTLGGFGVMALLSVWFILRVFEINKLEALGMKAQVAEGRIEAVADEKIQEIGDNVAAHREQLTTLFRQGTTLSEELKAQKASLEERICEAQRLEEKLAFTELRGRALEGSRKAYEALRALLHEDGEKGKMAQEAVDAVAKKFNADGLYIVKTLEFRKDGKLVPHEEVPLASILEFWPGPNKTAQERRRTMDSIGAKKDLSAIPFVLEKLKTEEDLQVCAAAVFCLVTLTGKQSKLIDYDYWLSGEYAK